MQVGTIIKSFDFPGNTECYIIGMVTKFDGDSIECDTIKQVFRGKTLSLEDRSTTFRTAVQGAGMFDESCQRIVEIG